MKELFKTRIAELQTGKTQKEFAKQLGVPLTSYTNWILGVSLPSLEYVHKICKATGVSADWLLGLSDHKSPGAVPLPTMPAAGLAAADHHEDSYLGKHPPPQACPRCKTLQAQVDKLVDTLHNLSVGRSQPERMLSSGPAKY